MTSLPWLKRCWARTRLLACGAVIKDVGMPLKSSFSATVAPLTVICFAVRYALRVQTWCLSIEDQEEIVNWSGCRFWATKSQIRPKCTWPDLPGSEVTYMRSRAWTSPIHAAVANANRNTALWVKCCKSLDCRGSSIPVMRRCKTTFMLVFFSETLDSSIGFWSYHLRISCRETTWNLCFFKIRVLIIWVFGVAAWVAQQ